jgi:phage replication O-like protein O
LASPQKENGHIRIANELWDEIIRRDFSKRQTSVLQLIWRLSYGCNKKSATIPKLKYFEVCGVGKQNIKNELLYLVQTRVIKWDQETNIFTFNKDYEFWQISPIKGWNHEDFKELLHFNLAEKFSKQELKSSQNENKMDEELPNEKEESSQNENQEVLKTRTSEFSKQELNLDEIPCDSKAHDDPKDSIKNIIKDINIQQQQKTAYELYQNNIRPIPSLPEQEALEIWITELGDSFVYKAIEECCKSAKDQPTFRFLEYLINQWTSKGARKPEDIVRLQEEFRNMKPKANAGHVKSDKLPEWIEEQEKQMDHPNQPKEDDEQKRKRMEELLKSLGEQEETKERGYG